MIQIRTQPPKEDPDYVKLILDKLDEGRPWDAMKNTLIPYRTTLKEIVSYIERLNLRNFIGARRVMDDLVARGFFTEQGPLAGSGLVYAVRTGKINE